MSSNIANDVRNIFMLTGTREPSNKSIPSANAISVAAGIAQTFHCDGIVDIKITID
jgi:hypothetical protein